MKKVIACLLVVVLVFSVVGCANATSNPTPSTAASALQPADSTKPENSTGVDPSTLPPFKVAMITPLSGPSTYTGNEYLAGYQSVFEMRDFKINGRKIEVVTADGYDMDTQLAEFERLSSSGITVFAGGSGQVVDATLATLVDEVEVLYISNHWDHTLIKGPSQFFNQPLETTDNFGADLATKCSEIARDFLDIPDPKNVRIAFVHANELQFLVEPFMQQANALGMQIVLDEGYPTEQKDFVPIITKMINTEYDIFVPLQRAGDGTLFQTKLYEMNAIPEVTIAGGAYYDTPAFADLGNEISNGQMTLSYPTPGMLKSFMPSMQAFYDHFVAKMGHEPLTHALLGFGSGTMIATVLEDTPPEEWENTLLLAQKIRALNYNYGEFPGWYWGIELDEEGRNSKSKVAAINQWVDGKLICIYPKDLAVGEPRIPWKKK